MSRELPNPLPHQRIFTVERTENQHLIGICCYLKGMEFEITPNLSRVPIRIAKSFLIRNFILQTDFYISAILSRPFIRISPLFVKIISAILHELCQRYNISLFNSTPLSHRSLGLKYVLELIHLI